MVNVFFSCYCRSLSSLQTTSYQQNTPALQIHHSLIHGMGLYWSWILWGLSHTIWKPEALAEDRAWGLQIVRLIFFKPVKSVISSILLFSKNILTLLALRFQKTNIFTLVFVMWKPFLHLSMVFNSCSQSPLHRWSTRDWGTHLSSVGLSAQKNIHFNYKKE